MRTIHVNDVTGNIREMCIEANHYLTPDMDAALKNVEKMPQSTFNEIVEKYVEIWGEPEE